MSEVTRGKSASLAALSAVAARGAVKAAEQLSEMLGRPISVETTGIVFGGTQRLMPLVGGADAAVAAVYLGMGPTIKGHVMLLFTVAQAHVLVDWLMDEAPGTTQELDDMGESALGEVGNITSAAFLNELGNATGVGMHPSPPTVIVDLAGALVDSVLTEVTAQGGELALVETSFREEQSEIEGFILLMPEPESFDTLLSLLQDAA